MAGVVLRFSTDGKPVDPLIGITVAGRYQIIERIGVGGMGTVYRGTHVRCGQSVAIKVCMNDTPQTKN